MITGGPGSGKTYTITRHSGSAAAAAGGAAAARAADRADGQGRRAPAGIAAPGSTPGGRRDAPAEVTTIHRLLQTRPRHHPFPSRSRPAAYRGRRGGRRGLHGGPGAHGQAGRRGPAGGPPDPGGGPAPARVGRGRFGSGRPLRRRRAEPATACGPRALDGLHRRAHAQLSVRARQRHRRAQPGRQRRRRPGARSNCWRTTARARSSGWTRPAGPAVEAAIRQRIVEGYRPLAVAAEPDDGAGGRQPVQDPVRPRLRPVGGGDGQPHGRAPAAARRRPSRPAARAGPWYAAARCWSRATTTRCALFNGDIGVTLPDPAAGQLFVHFPGPAGRKPPFACPSACRSTRPPTP